MNVLWRRAAREAVAAAGLALVLAGCREEVGALRPLRRAPLGAAAGASTIAIAPTGEVWLGVGGGFVVMDTLGRPLGRVAAPGEAPRLLALHGGRALVADGGRALALVATGRDSVLARRRVRRDEPVAADPRGRWTYTTYAWGSVLGLDSLLVTRWGWPDAGARATALAVGTLGDRVYLGLAEGRDQPPMVQILDAWSGRVVGSWRASEAPRGLAPAPDPSLLYAWDADGVLALRHAGTSLLPVWRTSLGQLRMDSVVAVRPSPDGARLAVVGRSEGRGRLTVLSAASGRDTARWNGSPPDAAWDARGRLLLPSDGALLWLR